MRPRNLNEYSSDITVCAAWVVALALSVVGVLVSFLYAAVFSGRSCFVCTDEDDYLEPETGSLDMASHPHFRSR